MAEWIYESGIGEARAALVADGAILEAQIEPEAGGLRAGTILDARLVETLTPRLHGRLRLPDGGEALLNGIPPGTTEGATLRVRIVRETLPERDRPKPPKAVPAPEGAEPAQGPDLLARIAASGLPVRHLGAHEPDRLEEAGWSELIDEATRGEIGFPGGALRMSLTPAMTLFDVDGGPPLDALAQAGAIAAARAIRRLDITGSIGIDLPTVSSKSARLAAAAAFDANLPQPFERTAINGFGFLQVIRRRTRPSLPERIAADPHGAALRAALRTIERTPPPPGQPAQLPESLVAHAARHPDWLNALERRLGRPITLAPLQ